MAGDIGYQHRQVFRDFLDVCQVRGRDSTGVIRVDKTLDYSWAKQVGPPAFLADSKEYDRLLTGDATVLIGHTRSKTSGEITRRNAHPFDYPEQGICGVHNGTLRQYHNLDGHDYKKVDSDVLYGHLAQNGPQDTFDRLQGAYACVWWNNQDKTLNFIRNKERPLWFTWTKDMKVMLWASEIWMFSAISRKIELWSGEGEGTNNKFYELPEHSLWRFEPLPAAKRDEPTLKMKVTAKIEPKSQVMHRPNPTVWRSDGSGVYVRSVDSVGGEVSNPFQRARATLLAKLALEADDMDELDDRLPWMGDGDYSNEWREQLARDREIQTAIPPEETSSHISNVSFLKSSAARPALLTGPSDTKSSSRSILSLPEKSSHSSPSNSSGEHCVASEKLSTRLKKLNGVSFRRISGIDYITDNVTSTEWSEVDFAHATGGKCTFCKEPVSSLKEVGTILSASSFICKSCLKQPAESVA